MPMFPPWTSTNNLNKQTSNPWTSRNNSYKQIKNKTIKQNALWTSTNNSNKQVNNKINKQTITYITQTSKPTNKMLPGQARTSKEVFRGQERTIPTQTDRQTNAPWTSRDNLSKPLFTLCFTIIFCR